MDFKVSQKQKRKQPSGIVSYEFVNNVFDVYPIFDGDKLTNVEIVEDGEELLQAATFATLRQRGSDPLALDEGIQWSEAIIGEVPSIVLLTQIKNAVKGVSLSCDVLFYTRRDSDGSTYLDFTIEIV